MKADQLFQSLVSAELTRAQIKHPKPLQNSHHAYAVILEELEEFWDEVRKQRHNRDPLLMLSELSQISALCARAAQDVIIPKLNAEQLSEVTADARMFCEGGICDGCGEHRNHLWVVNGAPLVGAGICEQCMQPKQEAA